MSVVEAQRICAALTAALPSARGWVVLAELRTRTGAGPARTLDLWALNTWPSEGFRSLAYEVKVSRPDFLREIQDPTKRQPAERLAGECYFATPPGLLRPDEVPEGWGLVEVRADGRPQVRKAAAQRRIESWPPDFLAAVARRVVEPRDKVALAAWRYAGQEVTEDVLLALAAERAGRALEDARLRGRREGREAAYDALADAVALQRTVHQLCGWEATSADGFARWFAGQRAVPPGALAALRRAAAALDDARRLLALDDVSAKEVP